MPTVPVFPVRVPYCVGYGPRPPRGAVGPLLEFYDFEVRAITRAEHRNWSQLYPSQEVLYEEQILRHAVLKHPETFQGEPWDWDRLPFGIPHALCVEIIHLSGFSHTPHPTIIQRAQTYLDSEEFKYDLLILLAHPYKVEELFDLDPVTWQIAVGMAQIKLAAMGIDPEAILNPKAAPAKGRRPAQPHPNFPDIQGFPQGGQRVNGVERSVSQEASLVINNNQIDEMVGLQNLKD